MSQGLAFYKSWVIHVCAILCGAAAFCVSTVPHSVLAQTPTPTQSTPPSSKRKKPQPVRPMSVVHANEKLGFIVIEGGANVNLTKNSIICFFLGTPEKTLCMRVVASNNSKSAIIVPKDRVKEFKRGVVGHRIAASVFESRSRQQQEEAASQVEDEPNNPPPPNEQISPEVLAQLPDPLPLPGENSAAARMIERIMGAEPPPPPRFDSLNDDEVLFEADPVKQNQAAPTTQQPEAPPPVARKPLPPLKRNSARYGLGLQLPMASPMTFNAVAFDRIRTRDEVKGSLWKKKSSIDSASMSIVASARSPIGPLTGLVHTLRLDFYPGVRLNGDYSNRLLEATTLSKYSVDSYGFSTDYYMLQLPKRWNWMDFKYFAGGELDYSQLSFRSVRNTPEAEDPIASLDSKLLFLASRVGAAVNVRTQKVSAAVDLTVTVPVFTMKKFSSSTAALPDGVTLDGKTPKSDLEDSIGHRAASVAYGLGVTVHWNP